MSPVVCPRNLVTTWLGWRCDLLHNRHRSKSLRVGRTPVGQSTGPVTGPVFADRPLPVALPLIPQRRAVSPY
jgi:hypothetical protein